MRRFILVLVLGVIMSTQAFALSDNDLMENFQVQRTTIYASLNLTQTQRNKIKQLDMKMYKTLEPELAEISSYINKIQEIANSPDCSIEKVDAVKANFSNVEKRISVIKDKYEIEFKKILTPAQKTRYNTLKKEQQAKMQRELNSLKNSLN